ncbi:MAG TPA: caspase family protein, partial [Chitinophagaceae bacterium]|nr:caspase family protein [Chitinophagaceae bacterium]
MHKVLKLILSIFFYSTTIGINAQNKHAVLVAVNDYYIEPGVKSSSCLRGCINDADAMKELLGNRFGFDASNIHTLYNEAATKKNFIKLMYSVLHACKQGDAVVFFYSGHGVWMTNHMLDQDLVKRGMSQSIVMSNLYAPGWDCLIRDETLKDIFNQFVNKQVTLTTIFDCCYSANLMMMIKNDYWTPEVFHRQNLTKKDLDIDNIPYIPEEKEPTGCRVDSSGNILDTIDTDLDGVPDCKDWQINSPANNVVDSLGVVRELPADQFLDQPDNYFNPAKFANDSAMEYEPETERSFNLKSALTVSNISSPRPSERKNSAFLSIAGTADNQKGLEINDVSGIKHGAFTAALLQVYRNNPPTLPVSALIKKVSAIMIQQSFHQTPSFHFDSARLKGNLTGTSPVGFSNRIKALCIANKGGVITINKGYLAGVAKGNIFSDISRKQKIQIVDVFPGYATAANKTNAQINAGQVFEMTDDYTVSNPLIKIFIPTAQFTPASFDLFFKNKILPQVNDKYYRDYNFAEQELGNTVIMWNDADKFKKTLNPYGDPEKNYLYVLLPVPSYIADQLKATFAK